MCAECTMCKVLFHSHLLLLSKIKSKLNVWWSQDKRTNEWTSSGIQFLEMWPTSSLSKFDLSLENGPIILHGINQIQSTVPTRNSRKRQHCNMQIRFSRVVSRETGKNHTDPALQLSVIAYHRDRLYLLVSHLLHVSRERLHLLGVSLILKVSRERLYLLGVSLILKVSRAAAPVGCRTEITSDGDSMAYLCRE